MGHLDPRTRDRRPLRELSRDQVTAWERFTQAGAWASVDGFNSWRGSDFHIYVNVLSIHANSDAAEVAGLPAGPVDMSWISRLRMAGDQLVLRLSKHNDEFM